MQRSSWAGASFLLGLIIEGTPKFINGSIDCFISNITSCLLEKIFHFVTFAFHALLKITVASIKRCLKVRGPTSSKAFIMSITTFFKFIIEGVDQICDHGLETGRTTTICCWHIITASYCLPWRTCNTQALSKDQHGKKKQQTLHLNYRMTCNKENLNSQYFCRSNFGYLKDF